MTDFTSLLEADQTLDELLHDARAPADGELARLHEAREAHRRGDRARAVRLLLRVTGDGAARSRVRLWAAATLRTWGGAATEAEPAVLGVVVTLAAVDARQVLAVYRDGSARYVVGERPAAVYEGGDAACQRAIDATLARAESLRTLPAIGDVDRDPRILLLTLHGNEDATGRSGARELMRGLAGLLDALRALRHRCHSHTYSLARSS